MNRTLALILILMISAFTAVSQNTNSPTTTPARPRTTNVNQSPPLPARPTQTEPTRSAAPPSAPQRAAPKPTPPPSGSDGVIAAFNRLREGIEKANVDIVMGVYWRSPGLILYNYNGTVTKGWDQVHQNRQSSYPEIKDVKLDVRDISVAMLGRDGAVVNCLWTQSQTYKGTPETASGRMTLVFKRFGNTWKAIHLHTSPDSPNPASIPPSEQTPKPSPTP